MDILSVKLTVAIPTFNRRSSLVGALERLLPQLEAGCDLVVLDNHSDEAVESYIRPLLAKYPGVPVRIVRHPFNFGADANILRSFEYATGEWLLILGDDDLVVPEAVSVLKAEIAAAPAAAMFTFLTSAQCKTSLRPETFATENLENFAEKLDFVGQLNFMSCSVWRVAVFRAHLYCAYRYTYSMGWTFALVIPAASSGAKIVFSHRALIDEVTTTATNGRWSYRRFLLGWPTLLEMEMPMAVRRTLAVKILGIFPPEVLAAYCLADNRQQRAEDLRYYYSVAKLRFRPYQKWRTWVRADFYSLLFIRPKVGWMVVKKAIKLANCLKVKNIDIEDLEQRNWS